MAQKPTRAEVLAFLCRWSGRQLSEDMKINKGSVDQVISTCSSKFDCFVECKDVNNFSIRQLIDELTK